MTHLLHPCGLHHIERAHDVAVDIGARVFKAVAHSGLCGEMYDHIGGKGPGRCGEPLRVLQHRLGGRNPGVWSRSWWRRCFSATS
jgi:hypothetical protein